MSYHFYSVLLIISYLRFNKTHLGVFFFLRFDSHTNFDVPQMLEFMEYSVYFLPNRVIFHLEYHPMLLESTFSTLPFSRGRPIDLQARVVG